MPSWLADNYNDSDGNPDLAHVLRDVKAIAADTSGRGFRATVVFQLRDAFGGYCDNQKATDSAFGSGVVRHPWPDGSCVPDAPTNLSVTAVGSGQLTVSWQEPLADGGSPIEGYKIQWKTGTREYASSRQAVVTDLTKIVQVRTISGLTNDERHTIRVLAYNGYENGDGTAAEVAATPTAMETSAPVLLLARFDYSWIRLVWNEALNASSLPPSTAFTVNVNGGSREIYEMSVQDNILTLGVSGMTTATDALTVSYTAPTGSEATPLRDAAGNNAPDFSAQMVRNDRIQIVLTDPGPDKTYVLGRGFGEQDAIEATVTFGEPVIVSGLPELPLEVGAVRRRAAYHSGSGTSSLVFRYELTEGETDSDGVRVPSSGGISRLSGPGLVRYASTNAVAPARLRDSVRTDYLVDAVRPTLVRANALANGNDVTLTWDKALDDHSAPSITGTAFFTVKDTSDDTSRQITAIAVLGKVVTLTLSSAVLATDRLTVSYEDQFASTPESVLMQVQNVHEPLKDTLGNHAATGSAAVSITRNPNSPPEFPTAEDGARSVDENAPARRNIGAPIRATDADSSRLTYSISGADAAFFDVIASSGQLRTKAALDYESRESYSFTMSVYDGNDAHGNADTTVDDTITVTIIVTRGCINAGRPPCAPSRPTVSSASDTSLRITWPTPRTPSGTSITGNELQYRESGSGRSWIPESVAGTDRSHTIENLTKDMSYEVQVRAMNDSGEYGEWSQSGTGTPGAVSPPPVISRGGGGGGFGPAPVAPKFSDGFRTTRTVPQNATAGDAVGDPVSATHPDELEIAYSLSGTDASLVTVDEETGQIRVQEGVDLTIGMTYTVNLTATDSAGFGAIIIVMIEVTESMHHRYDLNGNGVIERDEVIAAVADYFDGDIAKGEVIELVKLYFTESG